MKRNLLLFITFLLCSAVSIFMSINDTKYHNMLSLVNIESLANGELGDGTFCMETIVSTKITYQECSRYDFTYNAPYRKDVLYSCDGKGEGTCLKGHVYSYYDCENISIGDNDVRSRVVCKEY